MKWFTACNQSSLEQQQFFDLLKVAILSANRNTALSPYILYDGNDCEGLKWLVDHGVTVLHRSLSFYSPLRDFILENFDEELLRVRSGAFLRTELPVALKEFDITDRFVVYTDVDVVFADKLQLDRWRPEYLAACGRRCGGFTRFRIGGEYHFNSGVMVMNVDALRGEYDRFVDFVINNAPGIDRPAHPLMQKHLFMSDQAALNLYYRGRIDRLPNDYNWSAFRGFNPKARIVHFHGLKWTQWEDFLAQRLRKDRQEKFTRYIRRHRNDFARYVNWAAGFLEDDLESDEAPDSIQACS